MIPMRRAAHEEIAQVGGVGAVTIVHRTLM
jgi:hypothetical protein